MNDTKAQEIIVKDASGKKLTLTLYWDSSIDDWIKAFRSILFWLTFGVDTIDEYIPEEPKEIGEPSDIPNN
jgi:hypothetical protein